MEKDLTYFFNTTLANALIKLEIDSTAVWGKMTTKKMLFHLIQSSKMMHFENSNILIKEEYIEKAIAFLYSDKEIKRGLVVPKEIGYSFDDGYEIQAMGCTFTSTDLTITMEQSIDTAWIEPGFGDIAISFSQGMTIHCSRNTAVNTNVNQRVGNTDYSWFVKPKFNTAKLINSIKQK